MNSFKNFIYFVPTFRDDKDFDWFEFGFNQQALGELLESTNSVLVFRFHPFELSKIKSQVSVLHDRLIFECHDLSDPYPLLSKASILITDYSSIFDDFLLLDRPIIFANFDHQTYVKNERALYWDYDNVTPGVKVPNWDSLVDNLNSILSGNEDLYVKDRAKMRSVIYNKPPEQALKNVADLVIG